MLRPVVAVADARRVAGACQAGWLKSIGAELIRGHGRLDDHRRVGVATPDSGTMALTARHAVVICTGSRPALPELAGRGPALVSDEGDCGDRLIYQASASSVVSRRQVIKPTIRFKDVGSPSGRQACAHGS